MDRATAGRSTGTNRRCPLILPTDGLAQACRFKVPSDQILVEPDDEARRLPARAARARPPDRIIGRAWAHFYPVWDRHLL